MSGAQEHSAEHQAAGGDSSGRDPSAKGKKTAGHRHAKRASLTVLLVAVGVWQLNANPPQPVPAAYLRASLPSSCQASERILQNSQQGLTYGGEQLVWSQIHTSHGWSQTVKIWDEPGAPPSLQADGRPAHADDSRLSREPREPTQMNIELRCTTSMGGSQLELQWASQGREHHRAQLGQRELGALWQELTRLSRH